MKTLLLKKYERKHNIYFTNFAVSVCLNLISQRSKYTDENHSLQFYYF